MSALVEFLVLAPFALAAGAIFFALPGWFGLALTLALLVLGGIVSHYAARKIASARAAPKDNGKGGAS